MEFPDIKQLKKLADACRKAGIKSFKSPQFEFTLSDDLPEPKKHKESATPIIDNVTGTSFTEEELLFWSVGDVPSELESKVSE